MQASETMINNIFDLLGKIEILCTFTSIFIKAYKKAKLFLKYLPTGLKFIKSNVSKSLVTTSKEQAKADFKLIVFFASIWLGLSFVFFNVGFTAILMKYSDGDILVWVGIWALISAMSRFIIGYASYSFQIKMLTKV